MRAEVIAIGDELTSGQRLDTNSQWLSQQLGKLGVPVGFHTTVGDDIETNIAAFRTAIDRADIVVSTGGLGPTADDLTREALAAAVGVELVHNDVALAHIRELFARRRRPMPDQNIRQSQFPRGSRVIHNEHGTAPGVTMDVPRPCCPPCRVFALPGVPAEMHSMWREGVAPAIAASLPSRQVIRYRRIKCFGVGESDIEAMLPDMIRRKREPLVGITVSGATITLRVTARGPNETACQRAMEPTINQIREILGSLVFGEEDEELQHAVLRLLSDQQKTVAVAEWATNGLVSQWLASVAKDAKPYRGGIIVRDAATLRNVLHANYPSQPFSTAETASLLASGAREQFAADFGLGIAALPESGPQLPDATGGSTRTEISGTLYIALATAENVRAKGFPLASHPSITIPRAAKQALNLLRLTLLNTEI